jgi:hypothetical protein
MPALVLPTGVAQHPGQVMPLMLAGLTASRERYLPAGGSIKKKVVLDENTKKYSEQITRSLWLG